LTTSGDRLIRALHCAAAATALIARTKSASARTVPAREERQSLEHGDAILPVPLGSCQEPPVSAPGGGSDGVPRTKGEIGLGR
jgi:hypothetical protein